jgi:PAS domain S-box-containing protein
VTLTSCIIVPAAVAVLVPALLAAVLLLRFGALKRIAERAARERDEEFCRKEYQLAETMEAREAALARAYEELNQKTAFYEAMLHSSGDGIIALDAKGNKVFQNRRNAELWEFPQDVIDRDDGEEQHRYVLNAVVDPDAIANNRRDIAKNPGLCINHESQLKNGKTFEAHTSPVVGTDGTHQGRIFTFRDITARKQAENALRTSEMTLKSIFTASPIGFGLLSPGRNLEWCSEGVATITGYGIEELKSLGVRILYETEEEFLHVGNTIYGATREGKVGAIDTKWVSKDGRVLDIRLTSSGIDPKDPETRVVVTATDVTFFKRGEARLRESEQRYRVLFDDSPVGLAELDASSARAEVFRLKAAGVEDLREYFKDHPDKLREITSLMKILHVNNAAFDLYGVSRGEDREKAFAQLAALMHTSVMEVDVGDIVDMKGQLESEAVTTTALGRKMYLVSKWIVVPGFEDTHGRIIISFMDITRQKENEAALRRTKAQLSDAAELAHMAYYAMDKTGKNFVFNDAFYALYGTTAEREGGYLMPIGEYFARFVHPDDLPLIKEGIRDDTEGRPEVAQHVHRVVRRDGEVRHIVNRTRMKWNDAGQMTASYGTNQDVTERVAAEEKLRSVLAQLESKNGELEEAYADLKTSQQQVLQQEKMASIGVLAAGVAHEINNPMGFIISNLGSLKKYVERLLRFVTVQSEVLGELAGHDGTNAAALSRAAETRQSLKIDYVLEDAINLVQESLEGADRVKRIVQDLKNFSRVTGPEIEPVDINQVLESTINIVWNELKHKVHLKREYGDVPLVSGNQGQLSQVFMNMLVNAAQAIPDHGDITVRSHADGPRLYITISDTGCGIPEALIGKIFEPFYTSKEIGAGTGLGLSIAYDIVKKHKGDIEVESTIGEGTTFTVSLPVERRQRSEGEGRAHG